MKDTPHLHIGGRIVIPSANGICDRTILVKAQLPSLIPPQTFKIGSRNDRRSFLIVEPSKSDRLKVWGLVSVCRDSTFLYRNGRTEFPSNDARDPHRQESHPIDPLSPEQLRLLLTLALLQHSQAPDEVVEVSANFDAGSRAG
jgi:hypothetical protein